MFYIIPFNIFYLFIDKKSAPKKTPVTPLIDKRFLTKSLSISSFLVISKDPSFDTFFLVKILVRLGLV